MSFSKFFNEIPSHFSVHFEISLLFNFQRSNLLRFKSHFRALKLTAYLLYIKLSKMSIPFLKVFSIFLKKLFFFKKILCFDILMPYILLFFYTILAIYAKHTQALFLRVQSFYCSSDKFILPLPY